MRLPTSGSLCGALDSSSSIASVPIQSGVATFDTLIPTEPGSEFYIVFSTNVVPDPSTRTLSPEGGFSVASRAIQVHGVHPTRLTVQRQPKLVFAGTVFGVPPVVSIVDAMHGGRTIRDSDGYVKSVWMIHVGCTRGVTSSARSYYEL